MIKKTLLTLAIAIAFYGSYAQNTFPPRGFVGVGTLSPGDNFTAAAPSGTTQTNIARFENSTNGNYTTFSASGSSSVVPSWTNSSQILEFVAGPSAKGIIDSYQSPLVFQTLRADRMTIATNRNVGIGTTSPVNKLDVQGGNGSVYNTGGPTFFNVGSSATGETLLQLSTSADQSGYSILQSISTQGSSYGNIVINPNGGNVLIGKAAQTNAGYKLDVSGNVRANGIVVNTTGADFVFNPTYRLASLSKLKKYIDQHHHLPEIPAARQMQAAGLNVGENQVKLL